MIFLVLGCLRLGWGCVGIVLPILPTVPFFLAAMFCFANSSEKQHSWFPGTKFYKKHLESFARGMAKVMSPFVPGTALQRERKVDIQNRHVILMKWRSPFVN